MHVYIYLYSERGPNSKNRVVWGQQFIITVVAAYSDHIRSRVL